MKTITTASILCVLCGAAAAQSSVTIYGRADAGLVWQSNRTPGGAQKALNSSVWNPSQWGLRGQEDLGDGLRAVFDVGSTIILDAGATPSSVKYFDRNAYVGLSHPVWGTVTLGRQINTLADTIYVVDPLGARNAATNMNVRFGYLGGPGAVITNNFGPNPGTVGANLDRVDNSIKYSYRSATTGLSAIAMIAAGEGNGRAGGALLGYDTGPLSLRGSWMQYRDAIGTPFTAYATGIAYRLAEFAVKASYIRSHIDSDLNTAARPYANLTTQVGAFGVTWMPSALLDVNMAVYVGRRTQDGQPDQRVRKFYVAPEYRLSKRTSLVLVGAVERFNDAGSALDTGTPLVSGARSSTYLSAGITHAF
jgi:GBP family porin